MSRIQGKPTKEEKEILNILLEESAEVIQSVSKILRFGFDSCHPDRPGYTNRMHLAEECGDLLCLLQIAISNNIIDSESVGIASENKRNKLRKYSDIKLD